MTPGHLDAMAEAGLLESIDLHFAQLCGSSLGEAAEHRELRRTVEHLAAYVSRALREGHPCLLLAEFCNQELRSDAGAVLGTTPSPEQAAAALCAAPCVTRLNAGTLSEIDVATPLVLDESGRLYLARFFDHEFRLAERVVELLAPIPTPFDAAWAETRLDHYFPPQGEGGAGVAESPDLQRAAARKAMEHRLCVVSGGPGTGKTATVVKVLALLIEHSLHCTQPAPRIALLAPTGKAAARLVESVSGAVQGLALAPAVAEKMVMHAATIHKALGVSSGSATRFLRGPDRPLLADVVIVDEASMVDLGVMRHLICALGPSARLVLLGDRHQLASVEAGSVLAELCAALHEDDGLVELKKSYRFAEDSGIAALAQAVKDGDAKHALAVLQSGRPDLQFRSLPSDVYQLPLGVLAATPGGGLGAAVVRHMAPALSQRDPRHVLKRMDGFRVLCAHRRGPFGVLALNDAIRGLLAERGLVTPGTEFYRGRLLMVTQNDYALGLSNGDVGLCWPDPGGRIFAHFVAPNGEMRVFPPSQLPEHETAFALTVHKSQGSEYGEVAVVLPPEDSPLLTRELLYTAVTRARQRASVWGSERSVTVACERSVYRASGLAERIRGLR